MTELDSGRLDKVKSAMRSGNPGELLARNEGGEVSRDKMRCMADGQWLNDEACAVVTERALIVYSGHQRVPSAAAQPLGGAH